MNLSSPFIARPIATTLLQFILRIAAHSYTGALRLLTQANSSKQSMTFLQLQELTLHQPIHGSTCLLRITKQGTKQLHYRLRLKRRRTDIM